MKNNFGNYVIQKALKISINENKKKLVEHVSKNVDRLGEKKIIEKWRNILGTHIEAETEVPVRSKESKGSIRTSKYVIQTTLIDAPQEFTKNYQTPNAKSQNNLFIQKKPIY